MVPTIHLRFLVCVWLRTRELEREGGVALERDITRELERECYCTHVNVSRGATPAVRVFRCAGENTPRIDVSLICVYVCACVVHKGEDKRHANTNTHISVPSRRAEDRKRARKSYL